jgi:hypothetical protein
MPDAPIWPERRPTYSDPLEVLDRYGNPASCCDLWKNSAAFLVCGGPSVKDVPYHRLAERGIASLGINNVAGMVPVRAMTFCDPAKKFHHGVFLDPGVIKFVPRQKAKMSIRVKENGAFRQTTIKVAECPSVFLYRKGGQFAPETFLTSWEASWGVGKKWAEQTGRSRLLFTFFLGLRLLHYLGVRRIYLLGADFHMEPETAYAFDARHAGAARSNNNSYRIANGYCKELRPVFEAAGLEVYNCNAESGLEAWDHVPFGEALEDCRGGVPLEPFDLAHWYDKQIPDGVDAAAWLAEHQPAEDDRGEG